MCPLADPLGHLHPLLPFQVPAILTLILMVNEMNLIRQIMRIHHRTRRHPRTVTTLVVVEVVFPTFLEEAVVIFLLRPLFQVVVAVVALPRHQPLLAEIQQASGGVTLHRITRTGQRECAALFWSG